MRIIKLFEEFAEIGKWKIYAGLGGGFGGSHYIRTVTGTKAQAEKEAWLAAIEEYESYEGLHGLRTVDEIMDEDEVDEEEAQEIYNEEREGWLDYEVKPDDGIKEGLKIKDTNSLIVGKKYKITWPNYDDYEEGLEPEINTVEVIGKNKVDGYVLKDIEHDFTFTKHPNMLDDCEVELLGESVSTTSEAEQQLDNFINDEDKVKSSFIPKKKVQDWIIRLEAKYPLLRIRVQYNGDTLVAGAEIKR